MSNQQVHTVLLMFSVGRSGDCNRSWGDEGGDGEEEEIVGRAGESIR